MLAVVQVSALENERLNPFNKPFSRGFWNVRKCIQFISDYKFAKGDVVNVNETSDPTIFTLDYVDVASLSPQQINNLGLLSILISDVPVSEKSVMEFEVRQGDIDILTSVKSITLNQVIYMVLTIIRSPKGIVRARNLTNYTKWDWNIRLESEMAAMRKHVNFKLKEAEQLSRSQLKATTESQNLNGNADNHRPDNRNENGTGIWYPLDSSAFGSDTPDESKSAIDATKPESAVVEQAKPSESES